MREIAEKQTSRCRRASLGRQCVLPQGHNGTHEWESFYPEREPSRFTKWLESDEGPLILWPIRAALVGLLAIGTGLLVLVVFLAGALLLYIIVVLMLGANVSGQWP